MSFTVLLQSFWQDFFQTFIEFLYAPIIFPQMLWILIPVILAIFLMELYFNRYPRSGIGHHRHLENTIFLLFISFDMIRFILLNDVVTFKIYLAGFFIVFLIMVGVLDFLHKLPTSLIHRLSSKLVIAFISYIAIILVYSDILDTVGFMHFVSVILSIFLLFLTIVVVKKVIIYLEPKTYEEIENYLREIEEDVRKSVEDIDQEVNLVEEKESKKKNQPK